MAIIYSRMLTIMRIVGSSSTWPGELPEVWAMAMKKPSKRTEQKEQTHQRIVAAAARQFRE